MDFENLKNGIATVASICTILQFLTGILVCYKIVRQNSTGDLSGLPFTVGFLSTSLWLKYGFLIKDSSLITVNGTGAFLFFLYSIVFLKYTNTKSSILRQIIGSLFILFLTIVMIDVPREDAETSKHLMGVMCCLVTVFFFAAPLATFLKVIKLKNTESLPFPIILASFVVSTLWYFYGILIEDLFVQIPNFFGCVLSGFQLCLFVIYPTSAKAQSSYSNQLP